MRRSAWEGGEGRREAEAFSALQTHQWCLQSTKDFQVNSPVGRVGQSIGTTEESVMHGRREALISHADGYMPYDLVTRWCKVEQHAGETCLMLQALVAEGDGRSSIPRIALLGDTPCRKARRGNWF